jgi:diaminohydroxyphosphoribosylaminopyrimidine deaminase/5-amino-6-(5-phosphoribosylamino)uracil reductase
MNTYRDLFFLEMAYGLAEKAWGWSSPNPYVGAVIVKNGTIVGTGYHKKPGKPHAEAIALQKAGDKAKNATAYITLEPCVHWGRTPPCVDGLIQAGIKRVVISALDPNPLVHKKGLRSLQKAGIQISHGLLAEKNSRLNEAYNKYIRKKIPFVAAKVATTLDGKMSTWAQDSRWITSEQTRKYVHLLRGEYMAIMVGINTLLRDDPMLTIRHPSWQKKPITRVVIDSQLRFPPGAKILRTRARGRIWVFTHRSGKGKRALELEKQGVEIITLPKSQTGRIDMKRVLDWLGKQEISSVLVEGGPRLLTNLIEKRLLDKIFVTFSPKLVGGEEAPTFFEGKGISTIARSIRLKKTNCFTIGNDMILEGYF